MDKLTEVLGTWEGYRFGTVQRFAAGERGETAQVWLELLPDAGRTKVCDGCGEVVAAEATRSMQPKQNAITTPPATHLRCALGSSPIDPSHRVGSEDALHSSRGTSSESLLVFPSNDSA